MTTAEQENIRCMILKLASNNVLSQEIADKLIIMLRQKKNGATVKRHIVELIYHCLVLCRITNTTIE